MKGFRLIEVLVVQSLPGAEEVLYFFLETLIRTDVPSPASPSLGDSMAKFMLSLRDENFELLNTEAKDRGITVQELIRAVIIPDWVKVNNSVKPAGNGNGENVRPFQPVGGRALLQPMGRLRS